MSTNAITGIQGLSTNIRMPNLISPAFNTKNNSGLFGLQPVVTDYSNDIMASNFLNPIAASQTPSQNQAASTQYTSFQSQTPQTQNLAGAETNTNYQQDLTDLQKQINQQVAQENPGVGISEKGNLYQTSNGSKKFGLFAGLTAPLASGAYALTKGAKFANAFNLKNLLIKCPLFGVAGFAIGAIGDYFINRLRANNADNNAQTQETAPKQEALELKA